MRAEPPSATHILLVEDEPANRLLVRTVVAKANARGLGPFDLLEATCLAEARRALAAQAPRAILLDVRLPDGSGLDLTSEAHDGRVAERPWIVVMSASVHRVDERRAFLAGADVFMGKPFRAHDLIDILERIAHGPHPASSTSGGVVAHVGPAMAPGDAQVG